VGDLEHYHSLVVRGLTLCRIGVPINLRRIIPPSAQSVNINCHRIRVSDLIPLTAEVNLNDVTVTS
jgi:hypothetical protein